MHKYANPENFDQMRKELDDVARDLAIVKSVEDLKRAKIAKKEELLEKRKKKSKKKVYETYEGLEISDQDSEPEEGPSEVNVVKTVQRKKCACPCSNCTTWNLGKFIEISMN